MWIGFNDGIVIKLQLLINTIFNFPLLTKENNNFTNSLKFAIKRYILTWKLCEYLILVWSWSKTCLYKIDRCKSSLNLIPWHRLQSDRPPNRIANTFLNQHTPSWYPLPFLHRCNNSSTHLVLQRGPSASLSALYHYQSITISVFLSTNSSFFTLDSHDCCIVNRSRRPPNKRSRISFSMCATRQK